jgi:hypothetical protein
MTPTLPKSVERKRTSDSPKGVSMRLLKYPWMQLPVLWTIVTLLIFAQNPTESVQSGPPDTTPYSRDAIPADVGRLYDQPMALYEMLLSAIPTRTLRIPMFLMMGRQVSRSIRKTRTISSSLLSRADGVPTRRSGTQWMAGTHGPSNSRFRSRRECHQPSAVLATKRLTMVILAD